MKLLVSIFLLLAFALAIGASPAVQERKVKYPGDKTYIYRVTLADKRGTPFSLSRPARYLSAKAIERRRRQHLELDSTDLPVNPAYLKAIRQKGVSVVGVSNWNNTAIVRTTNPQLVDSVAALACVKGVRRVWTSPDSVNVSQSRARFHTDFNRWDSIRRTHYGVTYEQVAMLGGQMLHRRGYTGRDKVIAVLDGGFMNSDCIPCMKEINVIGSRDFVEPPSTDVFKEMEHGTKVLSVIGVNRPGVFVGTAPDASFWLLRCEDSTSEYPVEEDYWASAAEFADSAGVDIISSSLGFHAFDEPSANYKLSQLDGRTALISRTASMLAAKGIVLVCSAGNDGMASWKKINVPADADEIITVGAVTPDRRNAAFSSIGPTADGRVKPDVMALGSPTAVITGRGTIIRDVGTSFSAPLVAGMVACLWQALPDATARDIIALVRRCASNYATPDNINGYGIPDFWKAAVEGNHELKNMNVRKVPIHQ